MTSVANAQTSTPALGRMLIPLALAQVICVSPGIPRSYLTAKRNAGLST